MGLLTAWLGKRIRLTDGAFWSAWFGGDSWSGESVTADSTLRLSTAWACVKLVSQTVGTLPCGVEEDRGDGQATPAPKHDLHYLVHDLPNADATAVEFWEAVAASILLWGNSFALKEMNGAGRVGALTFMQPESTAIFRDKAGRRRYRYTFDGKETEYPEERIFHVRGFGVGGDLGLSPIRYGVNSLGASIAIDKSASKTLSNGMQAAGFVTADWGGDKPEQRAQLQEIFDKFAGSERAGKLMVIPKGLDFKQLTMKPADAEMLATRRYNIEEICRWFGVPPILIGHASEGQTMWGSGVEQIMLQFQRTGLRPLLKRIEAAASRDLFSVAERRRFSLQFNMEGLLRGDSAARAAFLTAMVLNGIYTRNEARGYEGKGPEEGGDMLTVQGQNMPLKDIGKGGAAAPIPAAGEQP